MIIKNLVGLSWAACLGDKSRDRPGKRLRVSPPLSCLQQEEKRTRNQTRPSQRPFQPQSFVFLQPPDANMSLVTSEPPFICHQTATHPQITH